jgi:hypothetical protein
VRQHNEDHENTGQPADGADEEQRPNLAAALIGAKDDAAAAGDGEAARIGRAAADADSEGALLALPVPPSVAEGAPHPATATGSAKCSMAERAMRVPRTCNEGRFTVDPVVRAYT